MRIALISARGSDRFYADSIFEDLERELHRELVFLMEDMEWMPNLGLLTLAGTINPRHDVVYVDEEYLPRETMERILHEEPFDLACLSVINAQHRRSCQVARILRDRGIPVAMGGIHPTALPGEAAEHCDFVFVGEAEETFPRFLKDFEEGKAERLYAPRREVDLSALPPPRFDLMRQFDCHLKYNRFPIQGTRGCPRRCDFCFLHTLYGGCHRHKRVEQVIREVEMVKEIVEDPFISFTDENMLLDAAYAMDLARGMKDMGVLWECYCDISAAENDELLDLLYQSHCVLLLIGLETLDPGNLEGENPWKCSQVQRYRRAVEKIQKKGLGVSGLFIVGFEGDGPDVFENIRDFAMETRLLDVEVSALCPFPGTSLYSRLEGQGRIFCRDWSKYTWIHVNYQPMKMTPSQVMDGLFRLFRDLTCLDRLIMQKRYFREAYKRLFGERASPGGKPTFLSAK
jgi:radical SAM superfamily enzyme YgiQ (UPF0313 family)